MASKYSLAWQTARISAKRAFSLGAKVSIVMTYYNNRMSYPAYERVDNWFRMMLAAGYKKGERDRLKEAYAKFKTQVPTTHKDVGEYPIEMLPRGTLEAILKDIKARRGNHQHGGERPAEEQGFIEMLEVYLAENREKDGSVRA